jgi:hypothetical protein
MEKPERKMNVKEAAYSVMAEAYQMASGNGKLPPPARMVMYAARGKILELTGHKKLNDVYFTQTLLPDYQTEHPDETASWDVTFDARGTFIEPHTGREVPLGTLDVRQYLGDRPYLGPAVHLAYQERFPTSGPKYRYATVLFIEKEGFGPLLAAARIAERFDIAIMSTKGLSHGGSNATGSAKCERSEMVLVLQDFDVSGFSIFGTLGTDGRRYSFQNTVPLVDIGLRLTDIESLGLEPEPVKVEGDLEKRKATLRRHEATPDEIAFLLTKQKRVELNAMTAPQFIEFLEKKLVEHGVQSRCRMTCLNECRNYSPRFLPCHGMRL